jgi:AcrR family transcriptional regulator
MKVSQEQKSQIRQKLLEASVELFVEKGFAATTMRDISKRAGFSEGTVYNYFATKEGIFYAYFDSKDRALEKALADVRGFDDFTLKEKLQLMMETSLDGYAADRAFVAIAYKAIQDSPLRSFSELGPVKERFADRIAGYFKRAMERGEIPSQPFERFLVHVLWDYMNLVVFYWLRDESPKYANSTRLIDMSLDIYKDVVASGIVTKAADMLTFLFKSHVYGNIDRLFSVVSLLAQSQANNDGQRNPGEAPHARPEAHSQRKPRTR